MKNIIIATDYSESARNATLTGLEIARKINAEVILFHVNQEPAIGTVIQSKYLQMGNELDRFHIIYHKNICSKIVTGNPEDEIIKMGNSTRDCLVVMGMKGKSRLESVIFGSVATGVMMNSTFPVLLVPEEFQSNKFECCVLATDLDEVKRRNIDRIHDFINKSGMSIKVVNVRSQNAAVRIDQVVVGFELDEYLGGPGYERNFIDESDEDVSDTLLDFVDRQKADMLITFHKNRNFLKKIFYPSVTRSISKKIQVPLLVYPQK